MKNIFLTLFLCILLSGNLFSQQIIHPGSQQQGLVDEDVPDPNRQNILEDLQVLGSECVGLDCVTGEVYGFDTQRYKENNLRVHFDDTSASASFPGNDWRITINDSANGGDNYFSIDDATAGTQVLRCDAGAPNNSLRINSNGDVGINTANPVVELHIADGDSPSIRLEQDGSQGFTPQTWDIAGNETNFFVRDVTNGSNLPFRIRSGAGNANAIVIQGDGSVTIGTDTDQTQKLYVNGDAAVNGDIYVLSDRRIKKNIIDTEYGLADILQLSAKEYQYDNGNFKSLNLPSNNQIGLIAQDVEKIIPEIITQEHSIVDDAGEQITLKGVNYTKFVPVLIHAVQEQQAQIDAKDQEIQELKTQLETLKEQVDLITKVITDKEGRSLDQIGNEGQAELKKVEVTKSTTTIDLSTQLNNGRND